MSAVRFLSLGARSITGFFLCCTILSIFPLTAIAGDQESSSSAKSVDFERHLMGLLGRAGCNSGSCHGSFQGRGGFRLSLFGHDSEKDFVALTHDSQGRRINSTQPDRSLVLLKATGQLPHGGGVRFARSSWQYALIRDWIANGARLNRGKGEVKSIRLSPAELSFERTGQAVQLTVLAKFANGEEEDITRFTEMRVNDDSVAEVTLASEVKAVGPGDTVIIANYRGNVVANHVLVPVRATAENHYPDVPAANFIDAEVFAKLRRLNMVPSDLAGDLEFLRRVTIDTIGCLPSPDEVRAFNADTDPDKRSKKIDSLLNHPLHAALWATKFCDITGNNTDALEQPRVVQTKRSQMWHDWFRKRLAENRPYDEIVRGILLATSRDGKSPEEWIKELREMDETAQKSWVKTYADKPTLDLFWRRQGNVTIEQWGEKAAAAFLGIRLECAQCHKHPFDRWTQADYRSFASIFGQVNVSASPEAKKAIDDENAARQKKVEADKKNALVRVREVFVGGKPRLLNDPDTNRPLPPKALGGPVFTPTKGVDLRASLCDWLVSPENPYFAASFANRVWGHYLGVGLVDPVDNFSLANPPSNEKLLNLLAREFTQHHYDIRHLERAVLNSRAYQLASSTNESNRFDRTNYSHAYVKPLMAEVFLDVLNSALNVTEDFTPDAPPGSRTIEVGSSRFQNGNLAYCMRIFGRPPRNSACDCDRASEPALPQTLFLMADNFLLNKLKKNSRVASLLKTKMPDAQVLDELFLAALTRWPSELERHAFEDYVATKKDRQALFTDVLWALVNTREFMLKH
jgi:hypothetical protein